MVLVVGWVALGCHSESGRYTKIRGKLGCTPTCWPKCANTNPRRVFPRHMVSPSSNPACARFPPNAAPVLLGAVWFLCGCGKVAMPDHQHPDYCYCNCWHGTTTVPPSVPRVRTRGARHKTASLRRSRWTSCRRAWSCRFVVGLCRRATRPNEHL